MKNLISAIFYLFGRLPLSVLHGLAVVLGFLSFYLAPNMRRITVDNLRQANLVAERFLPKMARKVLMEAMKGGFELCIAWTRSTDYMVGLFREVKGWEYVEQAVANQQGLLMITPHLGSYDLAGRMLAEKLPFPLTAMYRPPKKAWLEPVMNAGRARGQGKTAPANAHGVRLVLKALRQKEAVVILPDQVPQSGEGVLASFFDKRAYSMTLAARLAKMDGVCPLFFVGERLPWARGFVLHIVPFQAALDGSRDELVQAVNDQVADLVRRFPEQYLFSYNRYKLPAGVDEEVL